MKKLVDAAIDHPVITGTLALLLVAFGLYSLFNLPLELDPRLDIPVIIVVVPYPGAGPEEIEAGIARELELSLNTINEVDYIETTCVEGACATAIRFVDNVDVGLALQDVRDAVGEAKPEFPLEAEEPLIMDVSFADIPLMLISLSGEKHELQMLQIAEDFKEALESVSGVSSVELYGGLTREVEVRTDRALLQTYGLTLSQIAEAVSAEHQNLPGGELSLETGGKILLRTVGKTTEVRHLEDIVVSASQAGAIHLGDVAEVTLGTEKRTSVSRLNGKDAVTLIVQRRSRINTLRTVETIKETIKQARDTGLLPAHIKLQFTNNQAEDIWVLISQLLSSAAYGAALVVALLFLFMGTRNAIIITIAIPFALLFALTCQMISGLEISSMTMFSSILILGMVVDGAIIVGESIYRQLENGQPALVAARRGIHEVGWPVLAADLTTISAFLPMVFMRGVMGQHMSIMPKIVGYTLLGSIIIDHFVLPMIASKVMKTDKRKPRIRLCGFMVILMVLCFFMPHTERVITGILLGLISLDSLILPLLTRGRWHGFAVNLISQHHKHRGSDDAHTGHLFNLGPLSHFYRKILCFSLKRRGSVLALGVLLFVITIGTVASGVLGNEFFSEIDSGKMNIHLKLPPGSTVEETAETCQRIEAILAEIPEEELENYVLNAGKATGTVWRRSDSGPSSGPEFADISIDLTDEFYRRTHKPPLRTVFEIRDWLQGRLDGELPGVTLRFEVLMAGPPVGMDVVVRCFGEHMDELVDYTEKLESVLKQIPGTVNVGTSYYAGRPEFKIRPRREEAARWGVTTVGMARTVMDAFYGREVADLTRRNKNVDIRVQLSKTNQGNLQDLLLLDVPTRRGTQVPLVEVADIDLESGLAHIQRRDQKRVINVFCDVDRNAGYDVADIRATIEACVAENPPIAKNITASVRGENEEQEKAMSDLKRAFGVGIVLIFCILTIQFNSFRQPLIVLLAIPLAIIGAVFGLYITGVKFGFMATIGIVALVGIVVNDNIVLVDYCNSLRRKGMDRDDALIEAGLRRLRPILLTTVTTLGGLLPLTLDWGGGGAFWLPLGVTIIFGLGVDSLLTLIIVPVIYSFVEKPGSLPARGRRD
ncbi:MAG: efflux RND transporter permease subunit [Phycisphaeraceae bacterium]|nr:efflux RND transporter permease subunit [Phycisphaeraceae bacterium]